MGATDGVWYYPYLDNLGARGVIPQTIKSVDANLTRGQMAEMIYRLKEGITYKDSHDRASLIGVATEEEEPARIYQKEGEAWVEITTDGTYRYIKSNGLPNHETGEFPNRANPNTISAQSYSFRVPLNSVYKAGAASFQAQPGIAVNGVKFEPGTAEFYQSDRSSGWNYEGIQAGVKKLGLDQSNAHVQPTGAYHYHSVPTELIETLTKESNGLYLVGYAADGHKMYYSDTGIYKPSHRVKSGTRPSGPGGTYNGTFTEDYEYVSGLGDLDQCNGIKIDGTYVYLLTDSFPYIPRCLNGDPDNSFDHGPGAGGGPPEEEVRCLKVA